MPLAVGFSLLEGGAPCLAAFARRGSRNETWGTRVHKFSVKTGSSQAVVYRSPKLKSARYALRSRSFRTRKVNTRSTAVFMICRISPWVMWEYFALPWHVGQVFPACTFSIGPLRKANATSAFASFAIWDEFSRTVVDFFIGSIVEGEVPHVSLHSRDPSAPLRAGYGKD